MAFLLRKDEDDVFLSPRQMQSVMDGDLVVARLSGKTIKGRLDGVVVEIKERKHSTLVGRYYEESGLSVCYAREPSYFPRHHDRAIFRSVSEARSICIGGRSSPTRNVMLQQKAS